MRKAALFATVLAVLTFLPTTVQAQYFGQNKVQWERFDFKVLRTEHFDIYYYDQEADVVNDVGRMAERWYARLSKVFNHSFTRKPIVLYANSADFHQTTTTGGLIGEGTGGFTDEFMNRVVLPLTGDYAENDHVLGHEIVHVFQYDIAAAASTSQGSQRRRFNLEQLPLWLVEGMAEYFSKGRIDPLTSMWIRDATIANRLPDLKELTRNPRYFPYRYGQAVLAYIGGRFGDEAVVRYFLAAGTVGIDAAFDRAIGISSKQLFEDWQESARELYNPVIQTRTNYPTPLIGRKAIAGKKRERQTTELNVGPALSPDGRYVAYLSARDLFSIDIFLSDAKTGKVIRRLVSSDRDAHFEALRFIDSAGAWSPDSTRLAFITFARGDNFIGIVDVNGGKEQSIRVPGVSAISNVAWSPDGHTLAIAGQTTGVTDLFLFDLNTKDVRRLTNDKFADLQPAFSPDGRTIAFVTDRAAASGLEQLSYSDMGISTIDVESGVIRNLPLFPFTKHINPQYGPDGNLYFIANPEGIPDIYRYRFSNGTIERVTYVQTGVAGITDLSPAMSVALKTGDIAFSIYEDDNYNLYSIPRDVIPTQVAVVTPPTSSAIARAALLPPYRATGSEITAYLQHPEQGLLPSTTTFEHRPYANDLHLAYLGPPTVGVSAGPYGNGIGGSVSAYFTDILGQHNVGFTFQGTGQPTGSFADQLGGELFYLNQKSRLNWGTDLVHVPSVYSYYGYSQDPTTGNQQYTEVRQIETITEISELAQYPFSATRRIEGAGGYQRYAYKQEAETWTYDPFGNPIDRQVERLPGGLTLNLWTASMAFVGDNSAFGFISPVRGTRYRYELETLNGDLKFNTALADWRKYFYARPVTFAIRGFMYGRYGRDEMNPNISPLYLGQGSLGRGYDAYGVNPGECKPDPGQSNCPVFDRLIGSRIGEASAEVRAPLLGVPGYGLMTTSFLPTEIFAFTDVAAAWTSKDKVTWKWATNTNERVPVASVGVGLRILLSYIPIEIYAAKPFQRPDQSVVYGFNIIPGW